MLLLFATAPSLAERSTPRGPLGVAEQVEQFPDRAFPAEGAREGKMVLDVIPVAATGAFLDHVARVGEVHDDPECGALGDIESRGDVAGRASGRFEMNSIARA